MSKTIKRMTTSKIIGDTSVSVIDILNSGSRILPRRVLNVNARKASQMRQC